MNITEILENRIIEKQKEFVQLEFSAVELINVEGVVTLKLTFNDLTDERALKILESIKGFLS